MLDALGIYQALKSSFEFDSEVVFRDFVRNTQATKWIIAADFVTTGSERANDTFAFTVYRYDKVEFADMFRESRAAIPQDIKRVKRLDQDAANFLADRHRFHFCFIPEHNRHSMGSLEEARQLIRAATEWVRSWPEGQSKRYHVRKFEALLQRSKARKFNYELLHDIALLSTLAAYIAMLIVKHSRPEMILLLFDRDRMTTAFDGIVFDMANSNFHSICGLEHVDGRRVLLSSGVDVDAKNGEVAWFDDLIRAPDYIAGTMAKWDFRKNEVCSSGPKFVEVIERAITENPHIAMFILQFGIFGTRCSRVRAFKMQDTNRAAYHPDPSVMVDYLVSRVSGDRAPATTLRATLLQVSVLDATLFWRPR